MVKLSMILQFVLDTFTPNGNYFQFQFQGCLFWLKIEDTILNLGLTHLLSSSITVSTIPEQRPTYITAILLLC